jgi:hypothetical protein
MVRLAQSIAGDGSDKGLGKGSGKVCYVPSIRDLGGRTLCNEDREFDASRMCNTSDNLCLGKSRGGVEAGLDKVTPKKQQSLQQ